MAPDGTQFILDCGTGLRMLGNRWNAENLVSSRETHIFVTHYHWDHIQGLPFFVPLYVDKNEFQFYSFRSKFLGRDSLRQVFETQMALPYFPVDFSAMSAKRKFRELEGGETFLVGENKVTARHLNHPQGCLGFRIETPAGTIVYATDNEPGDPALEKSLRELADGADIFVNDAQFTPLQLATSKKGLGTFLLEGGCQHRARSRRENLVLFHHDPDSTDRVVDSLLRDAREEFDSVFAASEGMVITLGAPGQPVHAHLPGSRTALRREAHFRAVVTGLASDGHKFQEETAVRDLALQGALISLKHSPQLQSELQVVMETPGPNGVQTMCLRGYVVRIGSGSGEGNNGSWCCVYRLTRQRRPRAASTPKSQETSAQLSDLLIQMFQRGFQRLAVIRMCCAVQVVLEFACEREPVRAAPIPGVNLPDSFAFPELSATIFLSST